MPKRVLALGKAPIGKLITTNRPFALTESTRPRHWLANRDTCPCVFVPAGPPACPSGRVFAQPIKHTATSATPTFFHFPFSISIQCSKHPHRIARTALSLIILEALQPLACSTVPLPPNKRASVSNRGKGT